jgi:gas vesicle protein
LARTDNAAKLAGALLLGVAIGGVLGVLFAPQKGSKTRKKLSGKSNGLTDEMNEKVKAFLEKFGHEAEPVINKANHLKPNEMAGGI